MNFKKMKRLLSVVLSATMILSSNMTGFAAEAAGRERAVSRSNRQAEMLLDSTDGERNLNDITEDNVSPVAEDNLESDTQTPTKPDNTVAIVGSTGYYSSLDAALKAVTAEEATETSITLDKDAVLSGTETYTLPANVTVDTKGHLITVEKDANITLAGSGTFKNEELATPDTTNPVTWTSMDKSKTMLYAQAGSKLTITGGTFNTKGVKLLVAEGDVNISGGSFACNIDANGTNASHFNTNHHYDGASLINVSGQGHFVMTGGSINANIGSNEDGMYGIYVNQGGIVELGTQAAATAETAAGPSINSYFAAVGMRHESPSGNLKVYNGTYQSNVICTGNNEQYNAVLYLAALCDVTIEGGTFTAPVGTQENPVTTTHIMSAPKAADRNVVIKGGSFTSGGSAFYGNGLAGKKVVQGGTFLGGAAKDLDQNIVNGYELNEDGGINQKDNSVALVKGENGAADTKWNTLEEAITNSAEGDTIELKSNIELTGTHVLTLTGKTLQTKGHTLIVKDSAKVKIVGGTVNNENFATSSDAGQTITQTPAIVKVEKGGRLVINGGTYTTNAVQALHIFGQANVSGGATFKCTATAGNKPQEWTQWSSYDGLALITVGEDGILNMADGAVTAEVGNGSDCGMYGIFVYKNGQVTLGSNTADGPVGPAVHSVFAAVGTNYTQPAAFITINGGDYRSSVSCTGNNKKFNAVLYLAANSTVVINGGHFEATADNTNAHVISIPYTDGSLVANVNLTINGGTFKSEQANNVFFVGTGGNTQKPGLVKGGKFSTNPTDFLATGYEAGEKGTDNYYTVELKCSHTDITKVEAIEPTCTKEGMDAHYQCTSCGQRFYTADGAEDSKLADSEVILPKALHESERLAVKTKVEATTCRDLYDSAKENESGTYYRCVNCGKTYANITDLKNSKNEVTTLARGKHTYGEGNAAYTINWGALTEGRIFDNKAAFDVFAKAYTANDITVTKECTLCHEAAKVEGTVELTSNAENALENYICSTAKNITIQYTVSLVTRDANTPKSSNTKETTKTPIGSRETTINGSDHQYEYVWSKTDSEKTAACGRYCKSCGDSNNLEQATEIEKYNGDGTTPLTRECWAVNKDVVLKAFFGNETDAGNTFRGNMSVTGQHNLKRFSYQAPTCAAAGHKAHYYCDKCKSYYLSPLATEESDRISEADKDKIIGIARIPHNFGAPKFEWENAAELSAKATFTCTQCRAYVTLKGKDAVTVGTASKNPSNAGCEEEATITYPVSVDFDSKNVTDGETDAFGEMILIYGQTPAEATTENYTGTLVRNNVVAGHRFVIDNKAGSLKWVDSGKEGKYYDVTKGVTVNIQCQDCTGVVTITTNGGASVAAGSNDKISSANLSGRVTLLKNSTSSNPTCTSDGVDNYSLAVTCKSADDDDYRTVSLANGTQASIENRTKSLGHEYQIFDVNTAIKDVDWDYPEDMLDDTPEDQAKRDEFIAKNPTSPDDVIVTLRCSHNSRHIITLVGKDPDNKDNVVLTKLDESNSGSGKKYEDGQFSPLSCTEDGVTRWAVKVKYQDKWYTHYETPGTAVTTDNESTFEDSLPRTGWIYIDKTVSAPGHKYTQNGLWDTGEFPAGPDDSAPHTDKVYYTYTCDNSYCSGEAEDSDYVDADKTITYGKKGKDGKWIKRIKAELTHTDPGNANCTQGGDVEYQFAAKPLEHDTTATDESGRVTKLIEIHVDALGHDYSVAEGKLTWTLTPDMTAELVEITLPNSETKVSVPPCNATAVRVCNRDTAHTDTRTATLNKVSEKADDGVTLKVEVTAYKAPLCEQKGKVTYKATLLDSAGLAIASTTYDQELTAKVHDLTGPVHIDWAKGVREEEIKKDDKLAGYRFVVDAYIVCGHKDCPAPNRPLPNDISVEVTADGACGSENGVTYTAKLTGENAGNKVIEPDNNTYIVKGDHKLKPVAAVPFTSCKIPYYKQHYHCSVCGKNYESPLAQKEYNVSFEGENHVYYGDPEWQRLSDTKMQAVFECNKCHEKVKREAAIDQKHILYYPEEPKCEDFVKEPDAPEIMAYYPVSVEFNGTSYESSVGEPAPAADHKLDTDGKCEYCENTFTVVNFYGINGTAGSAISTTYYKLDKENSKIYRKTDGKYTEVTAANDIIAPVAPIHVGKVFKNWTLGNTDCTTTAEVRNAILSALQTGGSASLTITSTYEDEPVSNAKIIRYNVVNGITDESSKKETNVAVGGLYTAIADEAIDSVKFSHWSSTANGSDVLSTNKEYKCYIATDEAKTIYAIYADQTTATVEPIKITDVYTTDVDGSHKISFVSGITLPSDCKFVSTGFVYATAATYQDKTKEEMTDLLKIEKVSDETKIRQVERTGQTANIYTINLGTNTTRNVHVRGYVIYENADGNLMTEYSEVSTASYSSLNPVQQ